jgi:hypothetical protein
MSNRPYPGNGQQGQAPAPLPASIRTNILAGGVNWSVDEEAGEVVRAVETMLLGGQKYVELRAAHRPIFLSRKVFEDGGWAVWTIERPGDVQPVAEPDVVRQINAQSRR